MCVDTARKSSRLPIKGQWARDAAPVDSPKPQDSESRSEVCEPRRGEASKRGFGGAQWRLCALRSGQFWRPVRECVSPYTVSTDNCVSWHSEWSRERGLLKQPGPECHPMLTLRLPLPKNSPSVLHDATQPVVRTFAVPCKLSQVNVREGERRSPLCGHPLHF